MDTTVLDRELARALAALAPHEQRLLEDAPRGSTTLLDEVRAWTELPPVLRVLRVAAQSWQYRGSRMHDYSVESAQRVMELREDTLGPSILAARALGGSPEVLEHVVAHPLEPDVTRLVDSRAVPLPREVRRANVLGRPGHRVVRVGASTLTFLAPAHTTVVIDAHLLLLDSVRPEVLLTAGRRLEGPRAIGVGPLRGAPASVGPRYVLLRLATAPHYARVIDLARSTWCAPERYASGPDRTVVAIDDGGVEFRASRPDRPPAHEAFRLEWDAFEWSALAVF